MKDIDWASVEDYKEFKKLEAGGYVCKIIDVTDNEEKAYLKIHFDIADGEYKGMYEQIQESKGYWLGNFIKSYKESAQPYFKEFKKAVEASNRGYVFNNKPETLIGKLVGLTIGIEEYVSNKGEIKTKIYVDKAHSVDAIRKNKFEIPDFKPLGGAVAAEDKKVLTDEEVPF